MKVFIRNGNKLLKFDANERQVKQVLAILSKPDAGLTLPRIANAVSVVTGVKNIGMKGNHRGLVAARYSYFYLAKKHTRRTSTDIGLQIGINDHRAVNYGAYRAECVLADENWDYTDIVSQVEKYLGI